MSKEVILTGIRANNDLTIGNYFGGLLPIIDMAVNRSEDYQVNLFVPDLHSFTTPIDHSKLQEQIWHNLRLFVAAGLPLDKPDIHIYRQSYIPAHSELTWILDCFTGFGQMKRMTQFKDKVVGQTKNISAIKHKIHSYAGTFDVLRTYIGLSDRNESEKAALTHNLKKIFDDLEQLMENEFLNSTEASVGLFNYPVLMASDILLYGASYVPVGEDQTQHLEFTRDIAERMNSRFDGLFTVPKTVKQQHEFFGKDQGLRIKDLQDPTKKMSKSDDTGKGVVFLTDSPEEAAKKIMSAATDSIGKINFDRDNQPGITNLLQILALITRRSQEEVNSEWTGRESYGDLKKAVAEAVANFLKDLQDKLADINDQSILSKLEQSETAMREQAAETLLKVQKSVGLRS